MKLEEVLNKDQLEKIRKVGEMSVGFKVAMYESQQLNSEAQKVLMRLVDVDTEDLIGDIVDDMFLEYMDKKIRTEKAE